MPEENGSGAANLSREIYPMLQEGESVTEKHKKRLSNEEQPLCYRFFRPTGVGERAQRFLRQQEFFRNVRKQSIFYVHEYQLVFVEERY
jgi:hypothetical protein